MPGCTPVRGGLDPDAPAESFLDQVLFWNGPDLERKLSAFQVYYNAARSHASLAGHTPLSIGSADPAIPAGAESCALGLSLQQTGANSQSPRDCEFEIHRSLEGLESSALWLMMVQKNDSSLNTR